MCSTHKCSSSNFQVNTNVYESRSGLVESKRLISNYKRKYTEISETSRSLGKLILPFQ